MPKDVAEETEASRDSLWLNRVYPDAGATLAFAQASIDEVKNNCIVILDANVLLLPYRLGATSLEELRKVFDALAKADQIFAPAQAVREFLKHRADKIRDIVRELSRQAAQINIVTDRKIGFLQGDQDYVKLVDLSEKIKKLKSETLGTIDTIGFKLRRGVGSDPVSIAYREIFASRVVELPGEIDEKTLREEMLWRYRHSIPPGYKDYSKSDEGIGDFLIWKTILKLAEDRQRSCIFVTEDAKSDWWVQSEGAFQPRLELLDEYRRASGGQTIHLMPLSDLLALYGAEKGAVEDAKRAEEAPRTEIITRPLPRISTVSADSELDGLTLLELAKLDRELEKETTRVATAYNRVEAQIKSLPDDISNADLEALMIDKARLFEELTHIVQRRGRVSNATTRKIPKANS
jgi:hypothetical protein